MTDIVPLRELRVADVQSAVRGAIRDGIDNAKINDFVASVDWSGASHLDTPLTRLLAELEARAHEFDEGWLAADDYRTYLATVANASQPVREDPAPYNTDADSAPK